MCHVARYQRLSTGHYMSCSLTSTVVNWSLCVMLPDVNGCRLVTMRHVAWHQRLSTGHLISCCLVSTVVNWSLCVMLPDINGYQLVTLCHIAWHQLLSTGHNVCVTDSIITHIISSAPWSGLFSRWLWKVRSLRHAVGVPWYRTAFDYLWVSGWGMSLAQQQMTEKVRRIVISSAWFLLTVTIAVFIPNIGVAIQLLGSLAAVFIFVFPGNNILLVLS